MSVGLRLTHQGPLRVSEAEGISAVLAELSDRALDDGLEDDSGERAIDILDGIHFLDEDVEDLFLDIRVVLECGGYVGLSTIQ